MAFALVLMAWAVAPSASAQSSTPPPPDQEWSVRDAQGFRSRNLSTGPLMQIRIDGSTPSLSKSSFQRTSTDRAENSSNLDFDADYTPRQNISLRREMRVDPKRRAVRILDIITNTDAQERSIRVDYSTSMSERGSVRYGGVLNQAGESREYGNGVPDDTVAAVVFAERQDSQALPFFVWGQSGARWTVNVQDVGSSVSLSYEGAVPANGKIALLHWVGVAGLDKGVKLERMADAFWKDGRLVNPMVSAEMAPLVVNFTPEALKATSTAPSLSLSQPAGRLVHFDKLCGKLSVGREEKDVLWMGKDEQLRGDVTGTAVQVKMDSRTLEVPLADIAGIRGGGGRGREHRVYLRNGAVLTGRASLGECRLAGELGNLTLNADAFELLLLRVTAEDGKAPEGAAAFVELQNGAVHWLGPQEQRGVQLVTVFGALPIAFSEIWSLERRAEPPFNLIATLADGSRIHGVAQQPVITFPVLDAAGKVLPTEVRTAEIVRFGSADLLAKEMALPGRDAAPTDKGPETGKLKVEPPARYCWLRDGSLLVGAIASPTLTVRTGGNNVELKAEDVARMTLDAANGNVVSLELRSGAKMLGELVSESLEWQLGSRKVTLPAGWLQEVVRKESAVTTPVDLDAARAPGENDPLALPKGVPKENLVEMKVDYPKATAEGPLRISGSVSLPRLDKCDEESVKKRLTFLVPKGTTNAALKRPVTVSAPDSAVGVLTNITDGSAKDDGGEQVALEGGVQWMQIDLGEPHHIWKVLLWHYHRMPVVYQDVIAMVSNDPDFRKDVKVIFNNDHDNSSNLGAGPDIAYVETNYGWLMDGAGAQGRYVRFYSNGNSYSEKNDYLEAMVFGTPVSPKVAAPDASAPTVSTTHAAGPGITPPKTLSAPASGSPAPQLLTKPTPAQLASTAAHKAPRDPLALPPGILENAQITIRPLRPRGAPVPPAMYSRNRLVHQQEHNMDLLSATDYLRVPAGTTRVSAGKPVTTSDKANAGSKDLAFVTDGHPWRKEPPFLNLTPGLQWVQIDLQVSHRIWKLLLWHDVKRFDVYEDVIVQLSDDPDFAKGVVTVFNNDVDDTAGLGKGPDPAYIETSYGRLMDGGGHRARYVRFYSRGNTTDGKNCYVEAAVYGTPTDGAEKEPPFPNEPMPTVPNNPLAIPQVNPLDAVVTISPTYPKALYVTSPVIEAERDVPNLERADPEATRKRLSFQVLRWSHNVAERKPVTSSAPPQEQGALSKLVDGNPDGMRENVVTLPAGTQWVQVDLGERKKIGKVLLWHAFFQWGIVHDVVVQVSDDATFASGVQTLFNNDHDNSAGLGKGVDPAYVETNLGRLIDGCEARGRYVRITTRGSTASPLNRFTEIMVFGKPVPQGPPGADAGEKPLSPAEQRAREDANNSSDNLWTVPTYPACAPGLGTFATASVDAARFPHLEKRDWVLEHARLELRQPLRSYRDAALHKPVSASVAKVPEADLRRVTNGVAYHDDVLELPPGLQWVQVDLGMEHRIWNILMWHNHSRPVVYQDVVVQISSDPKFEKGVITVFNNDHDNSAGLGKGTDPAYVETNFGRRIEAGGVLGRYVRCYSRGNSENEANHFSEVSVYGAWEPGIPGSVEPTTERGETSRPPAPDGTSVNYSKDYPRYTISFPNGGPVTVQKKDFPHLEQFDYERERSRLFIPRPNGVRLLTCQGFTSSSPGAAILKCFADGLIHAPSDPVLPGGLQWMQVDLGAAYDLWFVGLWHQINDPVVYHDVVMQASDDPDFKTGVHTLFNNDHDNSSGLGKGTDPAYLETMFGRIMPGFATRARYIRVYSRGNSREDVNRFSEIKVYGQQVEDAAITNSN
ncbi:discoidin domain-containing protein [Roseimicrobium gellanilyticum]|nr:discoidin domain-containing protein [Roseimicrobium gellanilyticum]